MMWNDGTNTGPTLNGDGYTCDYAEYTAHKKADVALNKDELSNVIEFIELNFIESIRNDTDVDNIEYIISMMNALQKLRAAYASIQLKGENPTVHQEEHK